MKFGDIYGFFTDTLRGRLILSVAVIHAVMMTLFIVDLTMRQRSLILEQQLENAAGLSQSLAVSAAGWIVARDISGLQELVEAQRRYPELIFAIVADESGQILAHTDKTRAGQYLIDLTNEISLTVSSQTAALTDVAVPAVLGGKFVGWSRIGIGQETAVKKLDEIILSGVLYALIATLVGALIAWSMGLRITRRLYTVENTIGKVKAGNNSARCEIAGTDEASMLAQEFNDMLDALSEREIALGTAGENLKEAQRLAAIGSWNWDAKKDAITWSEEYYRIYGLDPSQRPPGYEQHLKAYTPESAARLDAAVKKNMQTGESYELDLELAGVEARRWVIARSETVRNAAGEIIGLRGTAQDITERKRAEQKLSFLNFALNSVCEAAFLVDEKSRFHFVNEEACRLLGYTREQLLEMGVPDIDPDFPGERWLNHWRELRAKRSLIFEGRHKKKDGSIFPVEISANYIEYENQRFNLALVRDITEHKRAEYERLVYLKFMESMDRVNRAIQGADDLESMMSAVLDEVLSIFGCDRAFLLYPCDPGAARWKTPMERCRPEFPGLYVNGTEMPMDSEVAETLRILLASDGPVKFGPETSHPLPEAVSNQFGFKCFMAMAIYPKSGSPWQFGIHQCSYVRIWTADDERLFQEIGRRLGDGLSALLAYHNLKDSRAKLEEAQRMAHVGYWDRDFTASRIILSEEACRIFGISSREEVYDLERWHERWLTLIHPDDRHGAEVAAIEAINGGARYSFTYRIIRPNGEIRHVHSEANVILDGSGKAIRMMGMMQDITEHKIAEKQILKLNRIYAVLSNINQAIIRIRDREELLNEACRIAVEYGGFQMAWIGMANFQTGKVDVAASNGAAAEYLENIEIDLNDRLKSSGPTGMAIRTATHNISNNIRNDEKMVQWRDKALKYGYSSSAVFPLLEFGKSIGAFNIYSNETDFFDEEDIALLDEMAKDISFALEFIEIEINSKNNEKLLKQSEARLNAAQHIAHIGNWELDLLNNVLIWSDEIYRIFEIDQKYFGASYEAFLDAIHPQDRDAVNAAYTASLKNKLPYDIDHRLWFADGRIKYVHEHCKTYYDDDGKPLRSIGIVQDITERKQAEETIQKHYSTLRGIIDNTDALIFSIDGQYRYTSFNNGHAAVMRAIYGAEIQIGQSLLEYMSVEEDRVKARGNLDKALAGERLTEESYSGEELRNRLYFRVSHSPIKSETGEIIGVAVFSHDITGRKTAEERLKTSLKEKEVLLRELYHRTKNNMQVICSMLELYSMDFDDEKVKNIFSELNNKIRTMALVHQKLYKSQNLSYIGMKEYIRELVELLMKSYRVSPQRISPEYDLDDIFFAIDLAIPCGLLVNELISNVFKHAFPGSRQGRIEVRLKKKDGEYVELHVIDDGIGAPQGFDFTAGGKMGIQTVFALGNHQLQGKVEFESSDGVSCRVIFKNKPFTERTNI